MVDDISSHHRRSIRLPGYDYSQAGECFVTICVHERQCIFGEVVNGEMRVNALGKIVEECWLAIPEHFPNVEVHAFVVMPNHVHGVLQINEDDTCRGTACCAPTKEGEKVERFGRPVSGSVPTIMRSYKAAVSKFAARNLHISPIWQRNYYEHVITTEKEYLAIEGYIENNPANWVGDSLYAS